MDNDDKVLELLRAAFASGDETGFDGTPPELHALAARLKETGHPRHADVRELLAVPWRVPPMAPDGRPRPLACGGWFNITAHPGPCDGYELTLDVYAETVQGQAVAAAIRPAADEWASCLDDVPNCFERLRFCAVAALLGHTLAEMTGTRG
jgi:hypothetical protein